MTTSISHASSNSSAPVEPSWTFGDRLRKARQVAGMDQRQFAEALGVSVGSLPGWETDRQRPRDIVAIARRVEEVVGISATWMLGLGKVTAGYAGLNNRLNLPSQTKKADRSCSSAVVSRRHRVSE